jgi:ribonuclease HII
MSYLFDMAKADTNPKSKFVQKPAVICGMDEVGRGPWAGPLVTCALILPARHGISGIRDSKKLAGPQREKIYHALIKKARLGIGFASVKEVDALGLIAATNLAFVRALNELKAKGDGPEPQLLLVDGRDKLKLPYPHESIIKGDDKIRAISAASIVAKVTRDRMMVALAKKYPQYGFENHKGYGTAEHVKALKKHGACPIHRLSFQPVIALSVPKKSAKTSRAPLLLPASSSARR